MNPAKIRDMIECELCGKSEPEVRLVDFGDVKVCEGYCLNQAKENARINERDKVLEDRRL